MSGGWLDEYAPRASYTSGKEYYFDRTTALEIIARSERQGTSILGIDGALIENGSIREPIDAILVLGEDVHAYDATRRHVTRNEFASLVWCLTLGDDPNKTD